MRVTLALFILCLIVTTGATRTPSTTLAFQVAPSSSAGPTPMGSTEIDLVKWGITQGGLALVLIAVLISYRRDFFRRHEAKQTEMDLLREEKRLLAAVIEKNALAMMQQAVSVQANTEATRLLAQNVNNLAERRGGHRP